MAVSYLSDSSGIYILGDTFLRNFVSTFSFAEEKIEVGVNVYAPEGTEIANDFGIFKEVNDLFKKKLGFAITSTIIAALCFIVLLTLLIYAIGSWYTAD